MIIPPLLIYMYFQLFTSHSSSIHFRFCINGAIVFLPIVFTTGVTRQLFVDMGLTIAYTLTASLIVALTLVPAMGQGMLKKVKPKTVSTTNIIKPIRAESIMSPTRKRPHFVSVMSTIS